METTPAPAAVRAPGCLALHRKRLRPVAIVSVATDRNGVLRSEIRRTGDPARPGHVVAHALTELTDPHRYIPLATAFAT